MVNPIIWKPEAVESIQSRYEQLLQERGKEKYLFALFSGNPTQNAESWCPDCVFAYPIVRRVTAVYQGPAEFHFIPVGTKEEFRNKNHSMRIKYPYLQAVPTMILWHEFERWKIADKITEEEIWGQIDKYNLRMK